MAHFFVSVYGSLFHQRLAQIFIDIHKPVPELKPAFREMLENSRLHPGKRELYTLWLMKPKGNDQETVGSLCFRGLSGDGTVEIGYGLNPGYEKKGYMTEAVSALVDWVYGYPGVKRVEAETEEGNRPSLGVLERTGFVPTGFTGEEGPRFVHQKS